MEHQANVQTTRKQIDIEMLSARIRAAPAPFKKLTNREAVRALAPALKHAMASGHTAASLSSLLQQDGLKVGARTLALWLSGGDVTVKQCAKKAARQRAARSPSA